MSTVLQARRRHRRRRRQIMRRDRVGLYYALHRGWVRENEASRGSPSVTARSCCFLLSWSRGRCNNVGSFQGYTSDRDIWGRVGRVIVVGGFSASEPPLAMGSISMDKQSPGPRFESSPKAINGQ